MAFKNLFKFDVFVRRVSKNIVDSVLKEAQAELEERVSKEIELAINNSFETQSIIDGEMRGELGLTNAERKMQAVINRLKKEKKVKITNSPRNKVGRSLIIQAVPADWSAVLSLKSAEQTTKKGQQLEWLKWLLLDGDKIIVKGHKSYITSGRLGRSGKPYLMTVKPSAGNNWRVPPQFSGTASNNFITRAINARAIKSNANFRIIVSSALARVSRRLRGR